MRVGAIKTFTRWLEEQELIGADPYRKVRRPKAGGKETRILRPDDAKTLLATFNRRRADQFTHYVVVMLCIDTRLRRGEVVGAKLPELNLEQRWLQVWGKGRKQRRVPLSLEICSLLWRYINAVRKPREVRAAARGCEALFLSRWGTALEPKRLSYRFRQHVLQAGIQYRVRFHDLRHAAATWAMKAGMPKERVSRMLGNANDRITSIYEHLDFEDVQAAHSKANPLRLVS